MVSKVTLTELSVPAGSTPRDNLALCGVFPPVPPFDIPRVPVILVAAKFKPTFEFSNIKPPFVLAFIDKL